MRPSRATLEGARRSSDTEAGGVTRGSNAHLTASSRFVDRVGRGEKSTATALEHQESYVHDTSLLINAREWSRKKNEGSARPANEPVDGENGIPSAAGSWLGSGTKGIGGKSAPDPGKTCGTGMRPIREGCSRKTRPGTSATGIECSNTTDVIDWPTSTGSAQVIVRGHAHATRPIQRGGRNI